jgi:adenosine deaminase
MKMDAYCELHVHLEGCVWPEHVRNWWPKSAFLFPPPRYSQANADVFGAFLEHLRFGYNFLNSEDAYAEVAYMYASRSAKEGVKYAEIQINMALLNTWGIPLLSVLRRINDRVASIPDCPVLRYIVDLPWQFDPKQLLLLARDVETLYPLGLRAVSLGGNEELARPQVVAEVLPEIREAGLRVHCHAGETTTASRAQMIVELLCPDRIVHGVLIADWIESQGKQSPPVDICLSSNLALKVIDSPNEHPLRRWWQAGVPLSLSTDDPAIFGTTLRHEYNLAAEICPEMLSAKETLVSHWLMGATDPIAVKAAFGRYQRKNVPNKAINSDEE